MRFWLDLPLFEAGLRFQPLIQRKPQKKFLIWRSRNLDPLKADGDGGSAADEAATTEHRVYVHVLEIRATFNSFCCNNTLQPTPASSDCVSFISIVVTFVFVFGLRKPEGSVLQMHECAFLSGLWSPAVDDTA